MDESQKFLWKAGSAIFADLLAGVWIWSWIFPEDPNRYNTPSPSVTQSQAPATSPGSNSLYIDPCEDEVTVEAYQSCLEDQALEDWQQEREGEAGLP